MRFHFACCTIRIQSGRTHFNGAIHALSRLARGDGGLSRETAPMSFRALLSRSPVPLGTMIGEFDTPGIGHIAKAAGLDLSLIHI